MRQLLLLLERLFDQRVRCLSRYQVLDGGNMVMVDSILGIKQMIITWGDVRLLYIHKIRWLVALALRRGLEILTVLREFTRGLGENQSTAQVAQHAVCNQDRIGSRRSLRFRR